MNPKKLCSLGILDININLILTQSQAEKYNFDIEDYNTVSDLKNLFYPETEENTKTEIDYFNHIILSSDNDIINALLYINRAYKSKTFIEFIMPNKLDFGENTKFVHDLLIDVCNMNYLFLIENKLIDVNSNIKFNISIIDDDSKENIEFKSFDLFEMNDLEIKINDNESINDFEDKSILNLEYNFDKVDFFLIDLFSYKELLYKNNYNMEQLIYKAISNNKQIKIILIINKNCFLGHSFTSLIEKYKEIIELSDIIFCDKNEINYFFRTYNNLKNYSNEVLNSSKGSASNRFNNSIKNINNNGLPLINKNLLKKKIPYNLINNTTENNSNLDLLIFDNEKHRKNIPRISILFDINLFSLTIYGLIHNKSFRVCFYAGELLLDKIYKNIIKKKNIFKIDEYNVLVPNEKKGLKDKLMKINEKIIEEQKSKEKGFILDCTNINESKIKIYNPLLDNNCASYLLKKNIIEHLKNIGFINKNGIVLKDPDKYEKSKSNIANKKINLKPLIIEYDNIKLPEIQENKNICQMVKKYKENSSLRNISKEKEKTYYKTINNFHGLKRINLKNNAIYNKMGNDNSKSKKKKEISIKENNKIEEYLVKTTKNFRIKDKLNSNKKKNVILRNIKLNEVKNKLNLSKNKKIPKYNVYSKYLFQLYRPDIKLTNEILETKNKSHKKRKLRRVYSQT